MKGQKKAWPWLWVSLLVLSIDQLTKWLAVAHFVEPKDIWPFLTMRVAYNFGIAFSFLGGGRFWEVHGVLLLTSLISACLFIWLLRLERRFRGSAFALSLMLGGAMGNIIDRIRLGYVVDFLDFHVSTWHYPTFNVADSAICVGAFLLFIIWMRTASQAQ